MSTNSEVRASKFARLFSSADGADVLKILEQTFDVNELKGKDTHATYYNLGSRDVVIYIKQLINKGNKDNV